MISEPDWLYGDRRFPGELRLPHAACVVKVASRAELSDRCRVETRYCISWADLSAEKAAEAARCHRGVENRLHRVLAALGSECRLARTTNSAYERVTEQKT